MFPFRDFKPSKRGGLSIKVKVSFKLGEDKLLIEKQGE
jgi:hypothetical protein